MSFFVNLPILLVVFFLSACNEKKTTEYIPNVRIDLVEEVDHFKTMEFVGRLEAVNDTTIQAQVSGYLKSANFIEGDIVNEGDLLFEIDPSSYEAELAAAKARVIQAQALAEDAAINYRRGKKIIARGAISKSEMDTLTAKMNSTNADLKTAQANQKVAEINLAHTKIEAPFSGRIGEKNISLGDLVTPNLTEPLTTIVSVDPIYASFQVGAEIFSQVAEKKREAIASGTPPETFTAKLRLSSDTIYAEEGKFDFIANRINVETDTITIRASFPNPDGILKTGQYVRVMVISNNINKVLTVAQVSIITNQEGESVYKINQDNEVVAVKVETEDQIAKRVIVESDALQVGDRVIAAGLQKVKPGQKVQIQSENSSTKITK